MKVYVLEEHDIEYSEVKDVFDSLEAAQSFKNGKPEDWVTDSNSKGCWTRTLNETLSGGMVIKIYLCIIEWEVKTIVNSHNSDNLCSATWMLGGCIRPIDHKGPHMDPNEHSWYRGE